MLGTGSCCIRLGLSNAYRPGQKVTVTDLQHLDEYQERIDMVTIVVVGNSTTNVGQGHMVTPRGYEEKAGGNIADLRP